MIRPTFLSFASFLLAAGCFSSSSEGGVGGTATSTGTGTGSTSGSGSTGATSGSGSTSGSASLSDAGCDVCLPTPGGGGFCMSGCPPNSTLEVREPSNTCVFDGLPAGCSYPNVCGSGFACLSSDPANCGACGHSCGSGQGCASSQCTLLCSGVNVEIDRDPANCGACGNACGAGQACGNGICGARCNPTPGECATVEGAIPDGGTCTFCGGRCGGPGGSRCVDLASDSNNCGVCGTVCLAGQVCVASICQQACAADQVCAAGSCQAGCPAALTACGPNCVDLQNDVNNCGVCGRQCGACVGGACNLPCDAYGFDAG